MMEGEKNFQKMSVESIHWEKKYWVLEVEEGSLEWAQTDWREGWTFRRALEAFRREDWTLEACLKEGLS